MNKYKVIINVGILKDGYGNSRIQYNTEIWENENLLHGIANFSLEINDENRVSFQATYPEVAIEENANRKTVSYTMIEADSDNADIFVEVLGTHFDFQYKDNEMIARGWDRQTFENICISLDSGRILPKLGLTGWLMPKAIPDSNQ